MNFLSHLSFQWFVFFVFSAITVILLFRALYEPYTLTTEKITMPPDMSKNEKNPPSLRVLFLTDLHARNCKISDKRLLNAIFAEKFDLLLFGGDACNHIFDHQPALYRLSLIAEKASDLGIPCYAVRGNHDFFLTENDFQKIGFQLLENEAVILSDRNGEKFAVIGVDDLGKTKGPVPALPSDQFTYIPPERRILLAHQPIHVLHYPNDQFAFQLSGHYHGGQVRLPFSLEFRFFRRDLLSQSGIMRGFFHKNGTTGYISRGCGCSGIPLRLFSKPEITLVHFYFPDETSSS